MERVRTTPPACHRLKWKTCSTHSCTICQALPERQSFPESTKQRRVIHRWSSKDACFRNLSAALMTLSEQVQNHIAECEAKLAVIQERVAEELKKPSGRQSR